MIENYIDKKIEESVNKINAFCAIKFDISITSLTSRERNRKNVYARFMAWYIAYEALNISYITIGEAYKKHYSSIINGVKKISKDPLSEKILNEFLMTYPHIHTLNKP